MTYTYDELSIMDDIAAIATPLVPSAIAVIRTSGRHSIERVGRVFSRPDALKCAAGNTMVHGWIKNKKGQRVDEVVVGVWRQPASFTGQDAVEIFCHGGVAVVQAVFNLLLEAGFRQAERGEFSLRAFMAAKIDLTQAEAIAEIIDGKTREEAIMACQRLSGSVRDCIHCVKEVVVDTMANIEVQVEYPEDEDNFADSVDMSGIIKAHYVLTELSSSWQVARIYQEGVRVVICGKSNAGKSTLFNALIKEERAITSEQAGTTRDWLEVQTSFVGVPVQLFDTAGFREAIESIEIEGQSRARQLVESADIVVYVVDNTVGLGDDDLEYIKAVHDHGGCIVIAINKCDIAPEKMTLEPCVERLFSGRANVSAKTGEGIEGLVAQVAYLAQHKDGGERHAVSLGSERQKRYVDEAAASLSHAIATVQEHTLGLDAVMQDLENALCALVAITGEVTTEDVLESVFSRFCVGK